MLLFQPNNLSARRPVIATLQDAATASEIAPVLSCYGLPASPARIGVFTGPGVISRNYEVEWPDRKIFLKSRDGAGEEKRLRHEVSLGRYFRDRGIPLPATLKTRSGSDVVVRGERCWVSYEFEQGEYFHGLPGQLAKAAQVFAQLTLAARDLPEPRYEKRGEQSGFLAELASLLAPRALDHVDDEAVRRLVAERGAYAIKVLNDVRARSEDVEAVIAVTHTDFHPHNLLFRPDGTVCVLDLEDVKSYPLLAALGFGSYKLIRQMWTGADLRETYQRPGILIDQWRALGNQLASRAYTVEELGLGARYRVLSLVHFILDNAAKGNTEFTYELEKQLDSLREIDVLYGPPGTQAAALN